jgi:nicotinamidase-related amidase
MVRKKPRGRESAARTALVLVDFVNDFDYPGGEALLRATRRVVPAVMRLADRAREASVPVIYANDNFERWRSDFSGQVRRLSAPEHPAASIVGPLAPGPDDYYVLKPRHSAFHATPLELLLHSLGVERLVLAGIAADSCVLISACDAHVRGFAVNVPADCVASARDKDAREALDVMARAAQADIRPSARVRWSGPAPTRRDVFRRSVR